MNENNYNSRDGESWASYFRRTDRFADLILITWGTLEFNIDQMMCRQHGIFYTDEKAKSLTKNNFGKKLTFLKESGFLLQKEFNEFYDFKQYRNKIFHGKDPVWPAIDIERKRDIMDKFVQITDLSIDILLSRKKVDSQIDS